MEGSIGGNAMPGLEDEAVMSLDEIDQEWEDRLWRTRPELSAYFENYTRVAPWWHGV